MSEDSAERLVRLALAAAGVDADVATVRKAELSIREYYGGARVYIRRSESLGKATRFATALASGASVAAASKAAGITSSWGCRLGARAWKLTEW
jgi:hypothetical protein